MAKYRVHLRIDLVTGSQFAPAEHADISLGEFLFDSMEEAQARAEEARRCFALRPQPAEAGHAAGETAR